MAEKIYIIPLTKAVEKACSWRKSKRGVRTVQKFLTRHTKRIVKIGPYLNMHLLQYGRTRAPNKVKVRVEFVEKDKINYAFAELFDAPVEVKKDEKNTKEKIVPIPVKKETIELKTNVEEKRLEEKAKIEDVKVEKKKELKVEDKKSEVKPKKETKPKAVKTIKK